MSINSLFQVYFNSNLKTKEKVYSFIADIACQDDLSRKAEIINQLSEREKAGSTLIAEHVMLPHIETDQIKQSQIIFIRLKSPILTWDSYTKDIRLLIVILLKQGERKSIKRNISLFIQTLADDDYVRKLLNINKKEIFQKEISKNTGGIIMKIVGVAACTVGIAHTYIAQEKLENAGKKAGHEIAIETQGTIGTENELTQEQIDEADIVILAADVKVAGRERFEGKRMIQVPTSIAVKSPNKLIEKAIEIINQEK